MKTMIFAMGVGLGIVMASASNLNVGEWDRVNGRWCRVLTHWNWAGHEGQPVEVVAETDCPEAKLLLNGKPFGAVQRAVAPGAVNRFTWRVPYAPGRVQIVGMVDGKGIVDRGVVTAGAPVAVRLLPMDKSADRSELLLSVVDANGIAHPLATTRIRMSVEGPGEVESPDATLKDGLARAFVRRRGPGEIRVTGRAEGLSPMTVSYGKKVPERTSSSFTVATFNVRGASACDGYPNHWVERAPRIAEIIESRGYDIVGLQEADRCWCERLQALLPGWKSLYYGRNADGEGQSASIVWDASRFDLQAKGNAWLSLTPDVPGSTAWGSSYPRTLTWGLFRDRKTGREFYLFNTHLDCTSYEARTMGMKTALAYIEKTCGTSGCPVFFMGDMNISEFSGEMTVDANHPIVMAKKVFGECWERSETPHQGPLSSFVGFDWPIDRDKGRTDARTQIDHIFVSRDVRVLASRTADDYPQGLHPSDHHSVSCEVELAPAAERPYAFRAELETVHEPDMRDVSLTATADEFAFGDGTVVTIPADVDEVLQNAALDFADYLFTSMGVSARVEKKVKDEGQGQQRIASRSPLTLTLDLGLLPRQYRVTVAKDDVAVVAADGKTAAQALYHLEDLMNLRRAPFLTVGEETRRMRFATRMVHSGWGMDLVPEKYMARMAHHGYDSLVVYVKRVGKTKSCEAFADVNALIRQAARHGLGVWLYTSVKAYVHPDDPGAQKVFDETYGAIAKAYPEAKGIVLVGESCAFPSKDERTCADPFDVKQARGDTRPAPGWFPCRDYPDWLRCVETAVRRHAPEMKVVFWTYNWAEDRTPELPAERLRLIDNLPTEGTVLQSTFEMPEMCTFPNGYSVRVSDYSIMCPGPGENFITEATRARARGLELFTMCNTGGHTWDFGTAPYQPVPFQWAKRNRALVTAQEKWGLSGLMESHHYGWYPSVVSELAKEAFTEGGLLFDRHIRAIAARDFGERYADEVVGLWRTWSAHAANQPPTLGNQYGPLRIGPAYPFNFGGRPIGDDDMPHETASAHKFAGMTHLNYTVPLWGEEMYDSTNVQKQVGLLRPAADDYLAGARRLREMAAALPERQARKAIRLAGLAEYLGRTLLTTVHLQLGALAWEKRDWKTLLEIGRAERANAEATLPLVDADSRLGFECSMEYVGGREQIEWKIARLDERLADYARRLLEKDRQTPQTGDLRSEAK